MGEISSIISMGADGVTICFAFLLWRIERRLFRLELLQDR